MNHDYTQLSTRPIPLQRNRVWRTYSGGSLLGEWMNETPTVDNEFPEEWIASTVKASNVGREHIVEGYCEVKLDDGDTVTLKDIIASDPASFLGDAHVEQYGSDLAVLVKAIDSSERLTIQVHPDRQFAMEHFQSRFGKTEAWFVLGDRVIDGEEPRLLLGFKPGMTKEKWRSLFEAQDIQGMIDSLHAVPFKKGDVFLVEGGVPHAIGSGCFLIEIQEPTDLTLRVERTTPKGNVVPDLACHQGIGFDKMLDSFHYEAYSLEETLQRWKLEPSLMSETEGGTLSALVSAKHTACFRMNKLDVRTVVALPEEDTFTIAIVASGEGNLRWRGGEMRVKQADQFFIPASCGRLTWMNVGSEPLEILLCYPPQ